MLRRVFVVGMVAVLGLGLASAADEKGKVSLQEGTWVDAMKRVAAHKGKIVVLDAWSTSCAPCMKEFPNLVKLHEKHGKDVACMSFACDYQGTKTRPPSFYKEKVLKFLTKQNATFDNLLSTQPADEVYTEMKISSIPAVFVFGRDGKLLKSFNNDAIKSEEEAFTYEEITKLVEDQLKKK